MLGGVNPVAAPHFNFTFPEPTGVVGVIAPEEPDVLGLVAEILPPLAGGNVVVAVVSERWPLLSLHLGEILGVADVPAGVVNLLSGLRSELVKPLAGHRDVDGILDATGDPEVVAPRRRQRHPRGQGPRRLPRRRRPRRPLADRALPRAQDRLAPCRYIAPAGARTTSRAGGRSTLRTPGTNSAPNVTTAPATPASTRVFWAPTSALTGPVRAKERGSRPIEISQSRLDTRPSMPAGTFAAWP